MEPQFATVVKLPKRVTEREVRSFRCELKEHLKQDSPNLIVDLSEVRAMDTAGLDALLHCLREVAKRDGAIQVGEVSPEAATVLELTRMDRVLEMFPRVGDDAARLPARSSVTADNSVENMTPQPVAVTA
jgi:anti-sigma B factor antagonist